MAEQTLNFALQPVPTQEAIADAPAFANAVQIVGDPNGFTVYFFAVPQDAPQLKDVAAQLDGTEVINPGTYVRVELKPVAKLYVPAFVMPSVLEALKQQIDLWNQIRNKLAPPGGGPKQ